MVKVFSIVFEKNVISIFRIAPNVQISCCYCMVAFLYRTVRFHVPRNSKLGNICLAIAFLFLFVSQITSTFDIKFVSFSVQRVFEVFWLQ